MKRREAVRTIAGAAAALGSGTALAGNIEPEGRLYGAPATLDFRRSPQDKLLHLALAREEIPLGVWDEVSALAKLAAGIMEDPEQARRFASHPADAFRALGYDLGALSLDPPEIRACLLLADEDVRQAVQRADAAAFIQALRGRGVDDRPERSRLSHALRAALRAETELGLLPSRQEDLSDLPQGTELSTVVAYVLVTVLALVVALAAVAVGVVAYAYVYVSGPGHGKLKEEGRYSLTALAVQSGSPELARQVRDRLLDETSAELAGAAVEAAAARGATLTHEEAARQVRALLERVVR